jgi:hypothetical protein
MFAACLLVFVLPLTLFRIIRIDTDLFYLIFLAAGISFLIFYMKKTSLQLRPALKSGWALGIIYSLFIGVGLLSYTLSIKSGLVQPQYDINLPVILWRGVVFGIISAAMISVFPFIAVWRSFAGGNPGTFRKIWVSLLAIIAIALTSLAYSAGISGLNRGRIIYDAKMSVLTGIPTLLSGNPLASPIAGAFLHSGVSMVNDYNHDSAAGIKLATRKDRGNN